MPFRNLLSAALLLSVLLFSCGGPTPSGGVGGGNIPSTKVEQGDAVLFRKSKKHLAFQDTTVILLDSTNSIRVNDVVFQGPEFNRLIANQWESGYLADSTLPLAFRIDFEREVYMGQRGSIYDNITRAQDTVRAFVMQRESIDSAAANRKYPILAQRIEWSR